MFEIRVCSEFDFTAPDYYSLYENSDATPFQHPLWMRAMIRDLIPNKRREPLFVVFRNKSSGDLVGLLPLVRTKVGPLVALEFLNLGVVDHACPILDARYQHELQTQSDLPDRFKSEVGRYDVLWIKHLSEQSLELFKFLTGSDDVKEANFSSYATQLGTDYENWKKNRLSANRRSDLKRKRARLAKKGNLEFRIIRNENEIVRAFDFLKKVRGERFKNKPGQDFLQNEIYYNFYKSLAVSEARSGYSVTAGLFLDGDIVAANFGIVDKRSFVYLLPGADYERFGSASPGSIMLDFLIEALITNGIEVFDFSIGEESYKKSFGVEPESVFTLRASGGLAGALGISVADRIKLLRK